MQPPHPIMACRFCAKQISIASVKCPHCGATLDALDVSQPAVQSQAVATSANSLADFIKGTLVVGAIIAVVAAVFGLAIHSDGQKAKSPEPLATTPSVPTPEASPSAPASTAMETSPATIEAQPSRWKPDVTYIYSSDGNCTADSSLSPQECVSISEAKQLCESTRGTTRHFGSVLAANYATQEENKLIANNGLSFVQVSWQGQKCSIAVAASGMVNGNFLRRQWSGEVVKFVVDQGDILAHHGLDTYPDR